MLATSDKCSKSLVYPLGAELITGVYARTSEVTCAVSPHAAGEEEHEGEGQDLVLEAKLQMTVERKVTASWFGCLWR